MAGLSDQVRREIEQLLAGRRKIDAIKRLREATGLGLADAKAAVEDWPAWSSRQPHAASAAGGGGGLNDADWRQIDALVAAGNKIQAIKRYREATGAGLKEAVDAVDARTGTRTGRMPLGETAIGLSPRKDDSAVIDGGRPQTVRAVSASAQAAAVHERSGERSQSSTHAGAARRDTPGDGGRHGAAQPPATLDNQRLREIERHLFAGEKRQAVATMAKVTGMRPQDARRQVDAIEAKLRETNPQQFKSRGGFGCGAAALLIAVAVSTVGGLAIFLV
jgi:ribosomal protein L7/L12